MQQSIDEDVIIEDINMIEIVDSKHSYDLMDDNYHDGGDWKETNGRSNCKIIQSKSMTVKKFQFFVNYDVVDDDDHYHDNSRNSNNKMDVADDNDDAEENNDNNDNSNNNNNDNNNNKNNNNNNSKIMMSECLLSCYIIQYTENSTIYHELLITCIDLNHHHHHHHHHQQQPIKRNVYCLRYFLPEVFKTSIIKQKTKFDLNENVNDDIGSVDKIDSLNNIKLEVYSRDNDDNNITDVSILLCIEGNYCLKNSISSSPPTTTTTEMLTNTFLIRFPLCHQHCIFHMLSFHLDKKNDDNSHHHHHNHFFPLSINTIVSSKGLSCILPLQKVFFNSALYCRLIPLRNVMILRTQGSRGIAIISNLVGKIIVLDMESNDDETDDDDYDEDDNGDDGVEDVEDSDDDEDDEIKTGGGR